MEEFLIVMASAEHGGPSLQHPPISATLVSLPHNQFNIRIFSHPRRNDALPTGHVSSPHFIIHYDRWVLSLYLPLIIQKYWISVFTPVIHLDPLQNISVRLVKKKKFRVSP